MTDAATALKLAIASGVFGFIGAVVVIIIVAMLLALAIAWALGWRPERLDNFPHEHGDGEGS